MSELNTGYLYNDIKSINKFRIGGDHGTKYTEEPTYLAFALQFETAAIPMPHNMTYSNPLFISPNANLTSSAQGFLLSRGMRDQAMRLEKFNKHLLDISMNTPWFFQSVAGIDKLWASATSEETMRTGYKGKDLSIQITTLESLDLKITYLADLYRKSIYDTIYMRELVPKNLRYFNFKLHVAEFRNISSLIFNLTKNPINHKSTLQDAMQTVVDSNKLYFLNNSTIMQYDCYFCEFDFTGSIPGADYNVNDFSTPAANSFAIKIGNVIEAHKYGFFDVLTGSTWADYQKGQMPMIKNQVLRSESEATQLDDFGAKASLGSLIRNIF